MPPTASASSVGGQDAGPGGQVHDGAFVVGGEQVRQLTGAGPERVGERLRDPPRVRVAEGQVADRVGGRRRCEFRDPALFVAARDGAQHAVDETRTCRIEFDACLLDGGGHRGVWLDPCAQQLVGAEPQQVQQHRVDVVDRPARCGTDHRVEQTAGAAGAVGQLGGERRVAADDAALGQQRR